MEAFAPLTQAIECVTFAMSFVLLQLCTKPHIKKCQNGGSPSGNNVPNTNQSMQLELEALEMELHSLKEDLTVSRRKVFDWKEYFLCIRYDKLWLCLSLPFMTKRASWINQITIGFQTAIVGSMFSTHKFFSTRYAVASLNIFSQYPFICFLQLPS